MMTYLLPLMLGLGHGVSDAAAGLLVGLIIQNGSAAINTQILFYNLVAFGLQPIAGLLFDQIDQPKLGTAAGLLITLIGLALIQVNLTITILLIGIGSACLHAGGGSLAITHSPGKASAVGVFASFGVVGLALGGMASFGNANSARLLIMLLLAVLAITIWIMPNVTNNTAILSKKIPSNIYLLLVILLIAIALRSTVWVGTQARIERYSMAALWLAVSAGSGKFIGGFAADRLGWKRWALVTMTAAGISIFLTSQWLPGLLIGALMLQSLTPLSVAAAGKALPRSPALASSLVLGTAIIAGGLPYFFLDSQWLGAATIGGSLLISILLYGYALKKYELNQL